MLLAIFIPFAIGAFTVLQGALNREIGNEIGLSPAVLVNSLILTLASIVLVLLSSSHALGIPEIFRARAGFTGVFGKFSPLWIVSGLMGFGIVAGIPWAIQRVGATKVFVGLIAAQLIVSLLWDAWVEKRPVTLARAGGSILALLSSIIVAWKG